MIDLYCERTHNGLLAEPLNLFTNIGFFVSAYLIYQLARKLNKLDWKILSLIALVALTGIGSGLFHTYAVE